METETIQKNGASQKCQMSKVVFFILFFSVAATCFAQTMITITDARIGEHGMEHGIVGPDNNRIVLAFDYIHTEHIFSRQEIVILDDLIAAKQNGKWGFIDITGKTIIPFLYEKIGNVETTTIYAGKEEYCASYFSEGLCHVLSNGKWGYIDKTGKTVIPFQYEDADCFSEGLAVVKQNGKYGYIDKTDKTVIPFQYEYADRFSEGLAIVKQNGKRGYIDKTGKTVIPFQYESVDRFRDGFAVVSDQSVYKLGIINKAGTWIIQPQFTSIERPFRNGYARVYNAKVSTSGYISHARYGMIDNKGNIIVPPKYDLVPYPIEDGVIIVKNYGIDINIKNSASDSPEVYLYHTSGKSYKIESDDGYCSYAGEGLFSVRRNGKVGYINKNNEEVIPAKCLSLKKVDSQKS
jgi:hypothetical protein